MVAVVLVVAVVGDIEVEIIEIRVVLAVAVMAVFEVGLEELREWFARRWGRAAGAGGTTAAPGPGGTAEAAGVSPTGGSAGASGGTGAAGSAGTRATRVGATGGVGAGGSADAGTSEGAGAGALGAGAGAPGAGGATGAGAPAGSPGTVPASSTGVPRPRPYFVPLLEQSLLRPVSPLPAPSPYTGPTGGLAERRAPASRPASPARPACTSHRTSRPRPPAVPGTHQMTLRPSTAPLRVSLPSPPESSLPVLHDPESDSLRAASPTVARFLATVVTDPSLASTAASALVAELVDFAARCRLDYAASLVAESASVCPPSVGGECALGTDVLEDRQEEFQCLAATLPHLVSTLLAPEGDPDAPDIPTPRSYAEAIEGPYSSQWQAAMDAEMASWKSTGTYVDEVPPPGANIVSGMWIFRVKRPPGSPPVFKARYVARGFNQRQGVDYFQTFSPTPKMTTLRVLLHVAVQRDYELHSLDFSTAFLQGSLHEEIWLCRPPSFTGSFPPGTQWSLRRPVYGLRQAPREWHDTQRTTLAALGFAPSTADPLQFLRTNTSLPPFYIRVYVDDLVFATADTAGLAHVKSELQKRHTCTDLCELRSYLGLQIPRDRAQRTITLTQSHMVQQVLQRFDFTYSSPQATPLSTRHSLSALPSDESVEPSGPYPELVGCLMYLMTCTRPDLAYPLSILARYVAPRRHRPEHMAAAKRVLRYLCSTSGLGLVLGGRRLVVLIGHADASWADDQTMQRSSQGYTFSLGSGSVSWRSTRSSSVLSSSCEAQIYAGAMAAQELRWLTYLLTNLGEQPRSPPVLYVDNKAMLALCREHRLEHRTKHIALCYFLARELQQRGQLRLAYVASEANTADIFTKALAPGDHQRFCTMLGFPTLRARYMRTSGLRANDDLWHQRLDHPSRVTLKNCIEAGVFAPVALLHPDGTEVRSTTQPRNCTIFLEATLSHQPFPLLKPGTNRYPKLHKVYSEFLNVGHCGINDELYTLTFVDAGTRYVWIVNVEACSRAYEVFHLCLAEFGSKELQDYFAQKGIEHHISLPYAHQQQGVAERTNCAQPAINHCHHRQSFPTSEVDKNKGRHIYAPRVGVHGVVPLANINYREIRKLRALGNSPRHQPRAQGMAHPGPHEPEDRERARDVIFYEWLFLKQFHEDERANANRVYANDGHSYATSEDKAAAAILEQDTRGEFTGGDRHGSDDDDDNSPGGGAGASRGCGSGRGAPKNPRQALTGPHRKEWRKAMDAEIKALEFRDTWVLDDRATIKGRRILSGKWFFCVKTAADSTIDHHTSVRILLTIAAARHLPLRQIDVKNAFLYALVDAVIYVEQPHMYSEGDSRVCQQQKSLYGIKQAPRLWQQYLHNILLERGFKQLPHVPRMYRRDSRGEYILLTVYVNDLLYTGSSNKLLEQFEKNLVGHVDISCNHDVKQFLGLNISYSPEAIHLSAAKYVEELGKCFNIAPAPLSTPYRTPGPNHKPDNKSLSPAGLQTYQQQLGCLLFVSVTCRPDLSYIASQLAQHSRKQMAENLLDLQWALQFFISTPNVGLCFSTVPTSSFNLIGYVDDDHAADPDN
ncbi:unnamed protein product [Closterium sp. NIES-54]